MPFGIGNNPARPNRTDPTMQPTHATIDLEKLRAAWEEYTTGGRGKAPDLDPLVLASWQRCAPRLNPAAEPRWVYVSDEVLQLTLSQHASLRAIALPIMEDIYQCIEGTGAVLLLLDSTTCLLEMLGHPQTLERASQLGIRQGAFLDESRIGTNAFSVALIESCPAQIAGAEHFLRSLHGFDSTAAPIYDLEGHPVGVIGLLNEVGRHTPQSLGIAAAAAKAIENQIQADLFVHEANARASELNAIMDSSSEAMLVWTAAGVITHLNPQAGQLLNLAPFAVVGRPLAEYITLPETLAQVVARGEELSDTEIRFSVNGAQRECLISLRTIRSAEGAPTAYIATLRRIEQVRQLVNRLVGAQARLTLDDIVGQSRAAQRTRRQALAAADAKACVLILGESGTGKNVLARAIHNSGRRAGGPFLAINCRAIPRELALSEFLGHEASAFGAASAGRPSKFELAHGGTLFLEEIESLPLDTQAALLRVIEGEDVIRLGGTQVIPIDVRVIASAAADLDARVAGGSFRSDLRYRLGSFVISIAPLRDRPEDISPLIDRLLEKQRVQSGRALMLSDRARETLCVYPWPGNIRELESVVERASLLCDGQPIDLEHLPGSIRQRRAIVPGKPLTEPVLSLVEAERLAILSAGRAAGGNLSETARLLGIGRTTLWRKMKELKIVPDDFNSDGEHAFGMN